MSDDYPHKVLEIPVEADEKHVREMLTQEYEQIEDEYMTIPETPRNEREERIMRRGSLIQELIAQLNSQ